MAFGSYGDMTSPVPGFSMSNSATDALGGIEKEEQDRLFGAAGQALSARAAFKGQEALARAQQYAADKQYQAATDPGRLITGMIGSLGGSALSGFTGGLGAAAGKKWFA